MACFKERGLNLRCVVLLLLTLSAEQVVGSSSSLPLPLSLYEITKTISVYSEKGNPQCFSLNDPLTAADIWKQIADQDGWKTTKGRVIFVTHGYRHDINAPWLHSLKNTLLRHGGQTVVLVGWGSPVTNPIDYKQSVANTQPVGEWLGEIVIELRRRSPDMYIWGIGHSVGAHLMGLAGRRAPGGFNRITGLDPSAPYLETKNMDMRLRRSDAYFVDVIHSDGCSSSTNPNCWVGPANHYATLLCLGTLDFFPNYGHFPPASQPLTIWESHTRAVDLFQLSVNHRGLFATNVTLDGSPGISVGMIPTRQVAVTAEMGYYADEAFIPTPGDSRVNFYIGPDVIKTANRMLERGRSKRDKKLDPIDCLFVPSTASSFTLMHQIVAVLLICTVIFNCITIVFT